MQGSQGKEEVEFHTTFWNTNTLQPVHAWHCVLHMCTHTNGNILLAECVSKAVFKAGEDLVDGEGVVCGLVGQQWPGGEQHGHLDPHQRRGTVVCEGRVCKAAHPEEVVVDRVVDRVRSLVSLHRGRRCYTTGELCTLLYCTCVCW